MAYPLKRIFVSFVYFCETQNQVTQSAHRKIQMKLDRGAISFSISIDGLK